MIENTYIDSKVKKYYAWQASNYDAMVEYEAPYYAEAVGLADARKGVLVSFRWNRPGMDEFSKTVGPTGRVNISEEMIGQPGAKMDKLGLGCRVYFQHGNVRMCYFERHN